MTTTGTAQPARDWYAEGFRDGQDPSGVARTEGIRLWHGDDAAKDYADGLIAGLQAWRSGGSVVSAVTA